MPDMKTASKFDKIEENVRQYNVLKDQDAWLYYQYYEPGPRQVECFLDKKRYLLFSTNNYLGLARNGAVIDAAVNAARRCGVGTGASMAVSGGTVYHKQLEKALKEFYNSEDCVILSSGFMSNSAVVTTFAREGLLVFCDKYLHISFINSLKLNGIEPIRYEHDDVNDLENKVKVASQERSTAGSLIITESVFSQHGEIAKIDKIAVIAKKYGSTLIVDDAHGLGTIGKNGYGVFDHYGLSMDDVPVVTGAMNKAIGSQGGYVVTSRSIAEKIRMKAYELIFTSSLPAMSMAAAAAALGVIRSQRGLYLKLKENIEYARRSLSGAGVRLPQSATPIIPIIIGDAGKAAFISKRLSEQGVIAIPIIPPAVPKNASRIRVQITAEHTKDDIDTLVRLMEPMLHNTI